MLAILEDRDTPSLNRLHALVVALDRAIADDDEDDSVSVQTLARAVVAVGRPLLEHTRLSTVAATLEAAEAFVRAPDEVTWRRYFECATLSYPYGSGDGCLAITGHPDPESGNGCRSGSGTLAEVAYWLGVDVVVDTLTAELVPWLRAESA
jgi:hypothetical protein